MMIGGSGGTPTHMECGDDELVGLDVVVLDSPSGHFVKDVRAQCGVRKGPWFMRNEDHADEPYEGLRCPPDHRVIGIAGRRGRYIDSLQVVCGGAGPDVRSGRVGGDGGSDFILRCPSDFLVEGLRGRSGALLDAIGVYCRAPDSSEPTPDE
jgi:hypothetical protein